MQRHQLFRLRSSRDCGQVPNTADFPKVHACSKQRRCPDNGMHGCGHSFWRISLTAKTRDEKKPGRREIGYILDMRGSRPALQEHAGIPRPAMPTAARDGGKHVPGSTCLVIDLGRPCGTLTWTSFQTPSRHKKKSAYEASTCASPKPTSALVPWQPSQGRSGLDRPEPSGPGSLATGGSARAQERRVALSLQMAGCQTTASGNKLVEFRSGPAIMRQVKQLAESCPPPPPATCTFPGCRDSRSAVSHPGGRCHPDLQEETFAYAKPGTTRHRYKD